MKTITVTHEDIRNGKPSNPYLCPVARAVAREFPGSYVSVVETHMTVDLTAWLLPWSARRFIKVFDAGYPVEPFTFELDEGQKIR